MRIPGVGQGQGWSPALGKDHWSLGEGRVLTLNTSWSVWWAEDWAGPWMRCRPAPRPCCPLGGRGRWARQETWGSGVGALLGVTWALKSWRVQQGSLVGSRAQGPAKRLGVLAGRARPGPARQPHQPQAPSGMGRKEVGVSVGQDERLLDTRHKSGGLGSPILTE